MIVKDFIFLTLIIILQLRHSEGQMKNTEIYLKRSPCCVGTNILINTGCLEAVKKREDIPKNSSFEEYRRYRMTNLMCPTGMYLLDLNEEPLTYVDEDDESLYVDSHRVSPKGMYCLTERAEVNDTIPLSNIDKKTLTTNVVALVCFTDSDSTFLPPYVTGILSFVSVGFLILTLLVYAIVPQLRDLQGKCIVCTAISLCFGFFHLAVAQLFSYSNSTTCQLSGFLLYFWMLGAFFWMNVVSFNVMKSVVFRTSTISEKMTFIYYNVYGWGMPFIFLIAGIIADNVEGEHVKPGFGVKSCWFFDKIETWSYFYGPVAILIACNIVMFIITSVKLWKQTSYENVTKLRSMRYKFLLYLKIFLVMGISWIFEIISFIHDTRHIVWLMMDTFNSLQGLVFFLVLVLFRKRALKGLATRGIRLPCAPNAHTGPDEECDEIIIEEEAPALTTLS